MNQATRNTGILLKLMFLAFFIIAFIGRSPNRNKKKYVRFFGGSTAQKKTASCPLFY